MIYDVNGNALSAVYDVDGNSLPLAYDKDGNTIFQSGLKVCTYNVGGWYIGSGTNVPAAEDSAYYALQNGMIADIDADILCLEEYWTNFSPSRTAASMLSQYYQYIETAGGSTQYMGRAICSKYPIVSYTQLTYTGETRYYDCAEINIDGVSTRVFVTHLHPSDPPTKIAEATELCNYIKAQGYERFIICGDFNSTLYDPFSETNAAIYNQFINEGCTLANDGAFGILPTACNSADWANDKFAIDNIICSSGFTIESVATDLTKTTNATVLADGKIDHVPFYAVIEAE